MLPLPSSPHRKELLAPKAFATLLSRAFGMSGIPAVTESSCSIVLQQVLRMEVPLPLHCQVPASLHQPCAEAFPASSRALPSSRELDERGWGSSNKMQAVTLASGPQGVPEQAGRYWVSGERRGHGTLTARGKEGEKPQSTSCAVRGNSMCRNSQMCSGRGGKFNCEHFPRENQDLHV